MSDSTCRPGCGRGGRMCVCNAAPPPWAAAEERAVAQAAAERDERVRAARVESPVDRAWRELRESDAQLRAAARARVAHAAAGRRALVERCGRAGIFFGVPTPID
jgi:hypothetical protein